MIRMKTASDVRRALQSVGNKVLAGTISTQQANSFVYVCNAILVSIRTDEQEKKITELEQMLENMEGGKRL